MQRQRPQNTTAGVGALILTLALVLLCFRSAPATAAIRGPLVPDLVQCAGMDAADCRASIAQPDDNRQLLRNPGEGLLLTWLNSPAFPLLPPGASVVSASLIIRAVEISPVASLAVQAAGSSASVATLASGAPALETREVSSPSLTAAVREAVALGRDLSLQLTVIPASGGSSPAVQIDFIALTIEYQVVGFGSPTPALPVPTATVPGVASSPVPGVTVTSPLGGGVATGGAPGSTSGLPLGAVWLDLPPAIMAARPACPSGGAWSLLYWNGPNDSPIATAASVCATGDRFWVFRNGKWLGYAVAQPGASDSWNVLTGEAHFVRGRMP